MQTNTKSDVQNYNDSTMTSLRNKYFILEDNLKKVLDEIQEAQKKYDDFMGNQGNYDEYITQKASTLQEDVENSIDKMDAEIQKSLSHQKAENSRLQQQISQLSKANVAIKGELQRVQRRIEEIDMQVGQIKK